MNQRYAKTNGACSVHIGLEYALCSQCMCPIRAFTRCGAFHVHPVTLSFSSQVRRNGVCACLLSTYR